MLSDGRPTYQKIVEDNVGSDSKFIIWYCSRKKIWCLSRPSQIMFENAFICWEPNDAVNVLELPSKFSFYAIFQSLHFVLPV